MALKELIRQLNLQQEDEYKFLGEPSDLGFMRLFGGHVLAQSLSAAGCTVEGRQIHSLHAYFLRPGDCQETITYEVDPIRDGRTFSTRRVVAFQKGKAIFNMSSSFQIPEYGLEHQISKPYAPAPDGVKPDIEITRGDAHLIPETVRAKITKDRAIEIRTVDYNHPLKPRVSQPVSHTWLRANGEVVEDDLLHCCLLAYASDFGLLRTATRPHGVSIRDLQIASLDHAMWFHRPVNMNNWLLHAMDSPSASRGRGFNRGNFFDEQGNLVASVTQEGLMRDLRD